MNRRSEYRSLLFDMGNVLVRFNPWDILERKGVKDEADRALMIDEVFRSVEWVCIDRGSLSPEKACSGMCSRLPERLHAACAAAVHHWDDPPEQIEGMEELVRELSGRGYSLYLLSNAGIRLREFWSRYPVSRWFGDRLMISAEWGLLKPEAAFYEKALEKFALTPAQCLFIDDNPYNIEGAARSGIDGIVFHGSAAGLRRLLREKGVDVSG